MQTDDSDDLSCGDLKCLTQLVVVVVVVVIAALVVVEVDRSVCTESRGSPKRGYAEVLLLVPPHLAPLRMFPACEPPWRCLSHKAGLR